MLQEKIMRWLADGFVGCKIVIGIYGLDMPFKNKISFKKALHCASATVSNK
jgi:hypothetical protein